MEKVAHLLWHNGFYDHPKDGIALYQGRKVWFVENKEWIDDDDGGYLNEMDTYSLFDLPENMMNEMLVAHEEFEQRVGYHTNHNPARFKPGLHQNWRDFYNDPNIRQIYSSDQLMIAGTFIRDVHWKEFEWWCRPFKT